MTEIKTDMFARVRALLEKDNFHIIHEDQSRPWGGFFVLNEHQIEKFIEKYFSETDASAIRRGSKLSPKILLVAPGCRLSWQYHHRRAELWTVVEGPVQIALSETDVESEVVTRDAGQTISLKQGQRHRLIGMANWGIVAEVWQHTVEGQPSDESDIVRVQDDFGR